MSTSYKVLEDNGEAIYVIDNDGKKQCMMEQEGFVDYDDMLSCAQHLARFMTQTQKWVGQ